MFVQMHEWSAYGLPSESSRVLAHVECFYRSLDAYDWILFLNTDDFPVLERSTEADSRVFMGLVNSEKKLHGEGIAALRIAWDEYDACCFRGGDAPRFVKHKENKRLAVRTQSDVDARVLTGGADSLVRDVLHDKAQVMHLRCDVVTRQRLESSSCAGNVDRYLNIEY